MLDQQHRNVGRQLLDEIDDQPDVARRHAGGRLVQQQHLGLEPESHSNLGHALAAVGEIGDVARRIRREPDTLQQRIGFVDHGAVAAGGAPNVVGQAFPLGHGERDVFQHAQLAEQLVDLEGADQPPLDAARLRQSGDVVAVQENAARRRRQCA